MVIAKLHSKYKLVTLIQNLELISEEWIIATISNFSLTVMDITYK